MKYKDFDKKYDKITKTLINNIEKVGVTLTANQKIRYIERLKKLGIENAEKRSVIVQIIKESANMMREQVNECNNIKDLKKVLINLHENIIDEMELKGIQYSKDLDDYIKICLMQALRFYTSRI